MHVFQSAGPSSASRETVDEPLPPDTEIVAESGSYTVGSMVSLVISAAGVVAFAV